MSANAAVAVGGRRIRQLSALSIGLAMGLVAYPSVARAQTGSPGSVPAATPSVSGSLARNQCPAIGKPSRPSDAQRRSAQDFARRAQEAAIVSDNATALNLYQRAAALDATDPATAYALGRAYESSHDARAIGEYCRFLSLAPAAPETEDVRRRVAALSYELLPRNATMGSRPQPGAGGAFAYGVLFPGGGQYYTHRPALGLLLTAAAAGALYYAFQSKTTTVQVQQNAVDPFGNSYTYNTTMTRTDRPNRASGILAAAGVSLFGALEAAIHAQRANSGVPRSAYRDGSVADIRMVALGTGVGVGVHLDWRL